MRADWFAAAILLAGGALASQAAELPTQEGYRLPPKQILEILDSESLPSISASPDGRWVVLRHQRSLLSLEELQQPVVSVAGHLIDPRTHASQGMPRQTGGTDFTLISVVDGKHHKLDVPHNNLGAPLWAPDSRRFAFLYTASTGVELWIVDTQSRQARAVTGPEINTARNWLYPPCAWMADSRRILCQSVVKTRGEPPRLAAVAEGPSIQETNQSEARMHVYGGRLRNADDEALYEYYVTSQPVLLDVISGTRRDIGRPAIYDRLLPSPDARYILALKIVRPYSYLSLDYRFPTAVDLLDADGGLIRTIAQTPLNNSGPEAAGWAPSGPRRFSWVPGMPATLAFIEASDDGDPRKSVPFRDRMLIISAPFNGEPGEVFKAQGRMASMPWYIKWTSGLQGNLAWGRAGVALIEEVDPATRHTRGWLLSIRDPKPPQLLWERNSDDSQAAPGRPLLTVDERGQEVFIQHGQGIYLLGERATEHGQQPFLDRLHLQTLQRETLFRSPPDAYESVVAVLDTEFNTVVTRFESSRVEPAYVLRDLTSNSRSSLFEARTAATDLARSIRSQPVRYSRKDGVALSGELYLPSGYRAGTTVPAVIWAYPVEYASQEQASQFRGRINRFSWAAAQPYTALVVRLLVTQGYAVLMNASMPVIGGTTANDTAAAQLVANAEAAVNTLVAMGVTTPDQIGIAGHSYGAIMVATLLSHSNLFAAGVAMSGAYDIAQSPFGFQSEGRSFWEAPQVYSQLSSFMHADRISSPLLLIHGELDGNYLTTPDQSTRMYRALAGLGRPARLVMLPHETHVYSGRESILHVGWEVTRWFDRYLRADGAGRRGKAAHATGRHAKAEASAAMAGTSASCGAPPSSGYRPRIMISPPRLSTRRSGSRDRSSAKDSGSSACHVPL